MYESTSSKPFPFYKSYIYLKRLQKSLKHSDVTLDYSSFAEPAYSNLKRKTIVLPFVEPLDLSDLETLLEHEEKHFEITRYPVNVDDFEILQKTKVAANILEDIVVNETISRSRLERVFKKIGAASPSLQITLWSHLTDKEKETAIKTLQKHGILKDDIDTEYIKEVFTNTISSRKEFDNLHTFSGTTDFTQYRDLFSDHLDPKDVPGDGPGEYTGHSSYKSNTDLTAKFEKIIRNIRRRVENTQYQRKYYGKKINRTFFENITEFHPFKHTITTIDIKRPKITILLDCSGSMSTSPEILAKSFIVALLHILKSKIEVILHNQYYTVRTQSIGIVEETPMYGDEYFEKLKVEPIKTDIFLVITDMHISDNEANGLFELADTIDAKKRYILCVREDAYGYHPKLNKKYKRILVTNEEEFIDFTRKLVGAYR